MTCHQHSGSIIIRLRSVFFTQISPKAEYLQLLSVLIASTNSTDQRNKLCGGCSKVKQTWYSPTHADKFSLAIAEDTNKELKLVREE